jgi:hypothetical protein
MFSTHTYRIKKSFLLLTVISLAASTQVFAQVDAGALQRNLSFAFGLPVA